MTDDQMVAALTEAIQSDQVLLQVLRAILTNNFPSAPPEKLQALCVALGLE